MAEFKHLVAQPLQRGQIGSRIRLGRNQLEGDHALETIAEPVVPAGMFFVAMTADVVTGACDRRTRRRASLAPCTLAYAMALPGNEQNRSNQDEYERLLLHKSFPLSQPRTMCGGRAPVRRRWFRWRVRRESASTYIGPFDHCPMKRPRSGPPNGPYVLCTDAGGPRTINSGRYRGVNRLPNGCGARGYRGGGCGLGPRTWDIARKLRRRNGDERGAEMVEFAIVVVLLIAILYAIISYGLILGRPVDADPGRR